MTIATTLRSLAIGAALIAGTAAAAPATPTIEITRTTAQFVNAAAYFDRALNPLTGDVGLAVPVWNLKVNGTNWLAFCIDPYTGMTTGSKDYVASDVTPLDGNRAIERLYSSYYGTLTDANGTVNKVNAVGFQLALWELYNDTADVAGKNELTTGKLSFLAAPDGTFATARNKGDSAAALNLASQMVLTARDEKVAIANHYDFTQFGNNGVSQTVVGAKLISPVPEPSTWAMLAAGLAFVAAAARRRVKR